MFYYNVFIYLQGFPAAFEFGGRFFVIIDSAPIVRFFQLFIIGLFYQNEYDFGVA